MEFSARFFNYASPGEGLLAHAYTWEMVAADDASGRELVRQAMRRAGIPDGQYLARFRRHGDGVTVEVDFEERPNQCITLMIKDPEQRYNAISFMYIKPVPPFSKKAMRGRLATLGLFAVCILGVLVYVPMHLIWVMVKPERALGIAAAFDRTVNAALTGDPKETISSRANRAKINGRRWGCLLCKLLDWFKEGHCEDSAGK